MTFLDQASAALDDLFKTNQITAREKDHAQSIMLELVALWNVFFLPACTLS